MIILEFNNVFYVREGKKIIKNFSLKVEQGDFISIMGSSGSGKSTFLKLCCHLISPTEGKIIFQGKDMLEYDPRSLRKSISYCFQIPLLFGDTVEDNLVFPYAIRDMVMDKLRVHELLAKFNLDNEILKEEIKNLSGGEKQRIALIRTLLFKPEIILLDEVTSSLDVDNTRIVESAVNSLNKEGTTVLWITHSPEQGRKYANKLLTIENGGIKSLEVLR
jgi:putative ABC transport system ATP-binding protein